MKTVYLLHHVRELDDEEDVKLLGVFSTDVKAKEAKALVADKPGFKDYPSGFSIDKYDINKLFWQYGFGFE